MIEPAEPNERLRYAKEGIAWLSGGAREEPKKIFPANGECNICDSRVEESSLNKFYCKRCQSYDYAHIYYQETGEMTFVAYGH